MKKMLALLLCAALFSMAFQVIGVETVGSSPGRIEFIGDAGSPNTFVFEKWAFTEVRLPEGDPERIQVSLEIETSSLRTSWTELQEAIKTKKDYFYIRKFPKAQVRINGAKRRSDGSYATTAQLTLKGISRPVSLTFTMSDKAPYQVKGSGVIMRREFNFKGDGPKDQVPVRFDITLPKTTNQ